MLNVLIIKFVNHVLRLTQSRYIDRYNSVIPIFWLLKYVIYNSAYLVITLIKPNFNLTYRNYSVDIETPLWLLRESTQVLVLNEWVEERAHLFGIDSYKLVVWKFCLVNNCQQNIFYVFLIYVCLKILIFDEWKCKQTRQLCCESGA